MTLLYFRRRERINLFHYNINIAFNHSNGLIKAKLHISIRNTVEPHYNEVLGTMKITLLYQVSHYIRVKKQKYKELGPAKLPCNAVVTPLRKVATYEPRIKEKLHELGKSKRITGY